MDHTGPLVGRANRALRYMILLIAENLLRCNDHFRRLGDAWRAAGGDKRVMRGAGRQAVLPDRLPHGGRGAGVSPPELPRAALHPREIEHVLCEHDTPLEQVWRDLREAAKAIPAAEHAAEAQRLQAKCAADCPRVARGSAGPAAPRDRRTSADVVPGRVR